MFESSNVAAQFYQTYYMQLINEIFAVMTGEPQWAVPFSDKSLCCHQQCRSIPFYAHAGFLAMLGAGLQMRAWQLDCVYSPSCKMHIRLLRPASCLGALSALKGLTRARLWPCRQLPQTGLQDAHEDPAPPVPHCERGRDPGPPLGCGGPRARCIPQQRSLRAPAGVPAADDILQQSAAAASRGERLSIRQEPRRHGAHFEETPMGMAATGQAQA